jgi:hypothetical protein
MQGAPDAFNCHSHAWHNSGPDNDGQDPNARVVIGSPRWDESALDDMANAMLLGENDTPKVGDVVVYAKDLNGDGKIDNKMEATHSALVTSVGFGGVVLSVQSKIGTHKNLVQHHPRDPLLTAPLSPGGLIPYGQPTFIFRK